MYSSSSSAFALYIEHFAYYCGFYFTPFRPSNSDFGYNEEGESTSGYTFYPRVGSFACPGIDTLGIGLNFKQGGMKIQTGCMVLMENHYRILISNRVVN
jgi:hypothetical protein